MPQKRKIIGFLLLGSILLFIVAGSFQGLRFQEGDAFPLLFSGGERVGDARPPDFSSGLLRVLQGLLVFMFILFVVHVVVSLFDQNFRKKLLRDFLLIAALILLMSWLEQTDRLPQLEEPGALPAESAEMADTGPGPAIALPPELIPPPWMLGVTIFVIAGVVAVAAFFGFRLFSKRSPENASQLEEMAVHAQTAINELEKAAFEFNDVIIRCYVEMSRTVRSASGIRRGPAMTTNEFGEVLLSKGFPGRPVHQLTELFEQVRYGRQPARDRDRQIAVDSLTEIVQFCREEA